MDFFFFCMHVCNTWTPTMLLANKGNQLCLTDITVRKRDTTKTWTTYGNASNESLPVLREEIVHSLKAGKSPGVHNIPSKLLKNGGEATTTVLIVIWQEDLGNEGMAKGMTQSLVIPSPKKGNLKQCYNYRTISHPSKIMFRVNPNQLEAKAEELRAECHRVSPCQLTMKGQLTLECQLVMECQVIIRYQLIMDCQLTMECQLVIKYQLVSSLWSFSSYM